MKQQGVHIFFDNENIVENLGIWVSINNEERPIKLALEENENIEEYNLSKSHKEISYKFSDFDKQVNALLKVDYHEDMAFIKVEAKIHNENVFFKQKYFSSKKGVTIKVDAVKNIEGLLAHYSHKDWWIRPYFKQDLGALPDRTQSLLLKKNDSCIYLLPVVDEKYITELSGNGNGLDISMSSYQGGSSEYKALSFVIAKGENPFDLSKKTIEKTLEYLGYPTFLRERKRYPEILEYAGWCSWDAFYHKVNEEGLLEKAKEFKAKKLPINWMIIDDGWLDVKESGLNSFEADKDKFPEGLKGCIKKLKEEHDIRWVGVWHTFMGYWGGIYPQSTIAQSLSNYLYKTNNDKLIPYPDSNGGFGFWNAWHSQLRSSGVDFVKVDSQSSLNNFTMDNMPIGYAAKESHKALEASVGINFDQCIINCMGMAAENIWSRPISSVSRSSDDFVPREENSYKEHALENAYNSFYHGQFYFGDWDMFWTNHKEAKQSMVLRAISGGPIYFSDPVGETDASMIWPLILKDGKIIRGEQPGMPTEDCLFRDPNEENIPLKIWNKKGEYGFIAALNICKKDLTAEGTISPSDIPDIKSDKYVIYDYFNNKCIISKGSDSHKIVLKKDEAGLYIIAPYKDEFAVIGLVNKYISPAAVDNYCFGDNKIIVHLTEGGKFTFFTSKKLSNARIGEKEAAISEIEENLFMIDCSSYNESVTIELNIKS